MSQEVLYIGQIFLSLLLGMIIGLERRADHKEAGPRTMGLVAMGSALFTLISLHGFSEHELAAGVDVSRIMSQVVTGVGFLGAGMIIFRDAKIRGLTTAAGIWLCAGVGMAVAVGWYWTAIITALVVVLVLRLFAYIFPPKDPRDSSVE